MHYRQSPRRRGMIVIFIYIDRLRHRQPSLMVERSGAATCRMRTSYSMEQARCIKGRSGLRQINWMSDFGFPEQLPEFRGRPEYIGLPNVSRKAGEYPVIATDEQHPDFCLSQSQARSMPKSWLLLPSFGNLDELSSRTHGHIFPSLSDSRILLLRVFGRYPE